MSFASSLIGRALGGLVLLAALVPAAHAYTPPPTDGDYQDANANIFLTNQVTRVDVTMDPGDFSNMLANPTADLVMPCTMRWRNTAVDDTVTTVGFRVRGGTFTRTAARKSYELDFNDFVPGRSFHGLESIDINGDHNDPTMLRRMLAHDLLRRMNLPTPRTHYVALYVNNQFRSIKIHTEHIDEEFSDSWFGNKDGNLYKCLYGGAPADLETVAGGDYQNHGGGTVYEEKNNDPLSDYSDLVGFIGYINTQSNSTMFTGLEHEINVDNFLRYLASDIALGNWDDYWYGSNNYYMYFNESSHRFEWIPYDYDNTLGEDFFGTDWSVRHFNGWGDGGFGSSPEPLTDAVFAHSDWRRQFRRYLQKSAEILSDPSYQANIAAYHNLIAPYFDGTIESGGVEGTSPSSGTHVPDFNGYNLPATYGGGSYHTMGIKPFMDARAAAITSQIAGFGSATPALPKVTINEVLAGNATTNTDNFGEPSDWIELYNDETSAIDISGWYISDDPSSPTLFQIPATTIIPAKGFLLIWADGTPAQTAPGFVHAPFAISLGGETVALYQGDADGRVFVDAVTTPQLITDRAYGRYPDGSSTFMEFCAVTPAAANDNTAVCGGGPPPAPPALFINEFMADNTTLVDNFGDLEDWVEIYNNENFAVDMSGMHLTDALVNPTKWVFPAGTTIAAKGFLLVWCDDEAAENTPAIPHAAFKLSKGGEAIGLYDTDPHNNQLIHAFTFGAQTTNATQGLNPDGVGSIVTLPGVTPGASNVPGANVGDWTVLEE